MSSFQKLHVSINNTQVTFYGGLFDIIEHCMLHTKSRLPHAPSNESEPSLETIANAPADVERLIETFSPDLMIIHVDNTEVKSLNKQNSYHYHLLVHRLEMKARLKSHAMRSKVSNMRIYTPAHEVLHLKDASVDIKSTGNVVLIVVKLNTLEVVYNHEDIYGWFVKIVTAGMKSSRRELILRGIRRVVDKSIEIYHSEMTQRLFNQIILNNTTEMRNIKAVLQMDDQVSSINASQLKFHLNQSEKLRQFLYEDYTMNLILKDRHWSIELITDSPLCWFMDQKYEYLSSESAKTYIRGSALFVGSSFLRVGSHDDAYRINLRVNTLRTEYSQKLTAFAVKSIRCCKEYIDLFTQLNRRQVEASSVGSDESFSIEKVLKAISLDVRICNVSCFFINRHDVCVYVNLADITSRDSFTFILDHLQVSAVDFSKYDSLYELSEFSSVYVSTKKLEVNLFDANDQPQFGVDFSEKLDCSWNAHFLRHLLSLARDAHRFRRNVEDAFGMPRKQQSLLPRSLPVGLDIKKLRNIRIKHSDVNVDKLILLINELSGENLFFYHYFH